MSTLNEVLLLLKYGGAFSAAVYGVYATVTDFHQQRGSRRVLTTKGYFGITLLVLSSLLSLSADMLKDHIDRQEAQQAKDEVIEHYETIIQDLKHVSSETARAANPIKDVVLSFSLVAPWQHAGLKSYRDRLDGLSELAQRRVFGAEGVNFGYVGRLQNVEISRESPWFPVFETEPVANQALAGPDLVLNFYRVPMEPTDTLPPADLTFNLSRRRPPSTTPEVYFLQYDTEPPSLQLVTRGVSVQPTHSTGNVIAVTDIPGSQLIVTVNGTQGYPVSMSSELRTVLDEVRHGFAFRYLRITMSGGRSFEISGEDFKEYPSRFGVRYAHTFPAAK